MAEANYLHSTLYCFSAPAYNEVIRRFGDAIENVSAKCWYDPQLDIFCLKTPFAIGPEATTALTEVLKSYIDEELAAAEREDRPPTIELFPDSLPYDGALLGEPNFSAVPSAVELSAFFSSPLQNTATASVVLHSVNLETSTSSHVKAFRLNKLPDELVDRILSSNGGESIQAARSAVTIRTVRWDANQTDFIFNGRFGNPINSNASPTAHIIQTNGFNSVSDKRVFQDARSPTDEVPVRTWDFKDEKSPGMKRFLEGMGEILEDPDTVPEKPEDAVKFLSQSTPPQPQGRPRVPNAVATACCIEESDDGDGSSESDDESTSSTNGDGVAASTSHQDNINRVFGFQATGNSNPQFGLNTPFSNSTTTKENEKAQTANTATVQSGAAAMSFAQQNDMSGSCTPSLSLSNDGNCSKLKIYRSSNEGDGRSSQISDIPVYDRKYAVVDKIGLGGIAANQAIWEHQNPQPKKKTSNKSGITRREVLTSTLSASPLVTSNNSAASSSSTGTGVRQRGSPAGSISSYALPSPARGYQNGMQISPRKWAGNVGRPQSGTYTRLVDDTYSIETQFPAKVPPGLNEYGPGRSKPHNRVSEMRSTVSTTTDYQYDLIESEPLIDLADNANIQKANRMLSLPYSQGPSVIENPMITCGPSPYQPLRSQDSQLADVASYGVQPNNLSANDDEILERLHIAPDESKLKRYTMNQKAKKPKGGKNQYKKPKATRAVLPKPDPMPAPQGSKSKMEVTAVGNSSTNASKPLQVSDQSSRASSPDKSKGNRDPQEQSITAVEELLSHAISSSSIQGAAIHAQFGIILTQMPETKDFFSKGSVAGDKFQAKLRAGGGSLRTTFFPRLTTNPADGIFLLDLAPGSAVAASTEYEFIVKTAEGSLKSIKFNQSDRKDIEVTSANNNRDTIYVHYPIRVWDAMVTVDKPQVDNGMAEVTIEFVSSIQTIGEPPSFLAMVPPGSFSVEKVHAKRIFQKTIAGGIELKVTEVQDLVLEAVSSSRYNFKATALPAEEMIAMQRLWWECSVSSRVFEDGSAAILQAVIDEMVANMDGVGFSNKGPWKKTEVEAGAGSVASTNEWFW